MVAEARHEQALAMLLAFEPSVIGFHVLEGCVQGKVVACLDDVVVKLCLVAPSVFSEL